MNFCSAKKRTLQSFVMKKADTANFCSQKKRTLQIVYQTLQNCIHFKFGHECDPSVIVCTCWDVDPKVTPVTNSDVASFFIPQPRPQQRPATTSPTGNTHHHEHPWPPTDHDNCLTMKHDNHTPMSPASMTMCVPSMLPAATSCNPHHKQTQPPKL